MHFIYMYMQKQICYWIYAMGVMIGLHRAIDIHVQITGHTKCQVDAGFEQIKKKF